jgi:hypothetical protein
MNEYFKNKNNTDGYSRLCKECYLIGVYGDKRKRRKVVTIPEFDTTTHKWCNLCESVKEHTEFYADKDKKDGLNANCKQCKRNQKKKNNIKKMEDKEIDKSVFNEEFIHKYTTSDLRKIAKNNNLNFTTHHTKAELITIIKENNHVCIANTFPYQVYFNKPILNFIEIYVLTSSDEHPNIIKSVIDLLMKLYELLNEYETFKINHNTFLLKYNSFEIKFIFVPFDCLCQVLMSLEQPYLRCGFFNDKLFITPDSKYIKDIISNNEYINYDNMIIDNDNIKTDDLILLLAKNKIIF